MTDDEILAGPATSGGSSWNGTHWEWFVEWGNGKRCLKRIEGAARDTWDVVNQQRAAMGLPPIDS